MGTAFLAAGKLVRRPGLATLLILVSLTVAPLSAVGQGVSKVGTTAGEFLQVGVGARAMAQGGAFVAAADDISSLYWNPAGLAHIKSNEVFVSHSEWLADITFDYAAIGIPIGGLGTLGISLTMLGVPDMVVRTVDRQEGTGETFDAADMAVALAYSRAVTDRFSVGVTAKYISQRIWHSTASGFAIDIGTQFRTDFFGGMTIGAALFNFGSGLRLSGRDVRAFVDPDPAHLGNNSRVPANYELDSFALPLNFQFGITIRPITSRMHQLTISADALHPSANNESVNVGMEYGFQNRILLRSGYQALFLAEREGGFSGGIGVNQPLFNGSTAKLDYAYRAAGRLGGVHIVGLALSLIAAATSYVRPKRFALGLLAIILCTASCGRSGPAGADKDGTVRLTYWSSQNPQERELARRLVDGWNRDHPGVQVTVQPLPAGQSSEEVLLAAVAAGTTPDLCSNIWPGIVADMARAGGVLALDEFADFDSLFQSRIPDGLQERFRSANGHVYQIPWKSNPIMMQYNVRLFREAGFDVPPRTYSEFLRAASRITTDRDGNGSIDQWVGYRDIQPIWHQRYFDYYAFYVGGSGGQSLFSRGELVMDTTVSTQVFGFFRDLYSQGHFPRTKFQGSPFISQEIATEFVGPWNIAWLEKNAPPGLAYAYAPLPVPDDYEGLPYTYGDYKNISVFANTAHPKQAWAFAKYLVSKEADLMLMELATQIPIRRDLLTDSTYAEYFAGARQMRAFAGQVEQTVGVEEVGSFAEMLDAIAQQFEAASVYGVRSPEEATRLAVRRIRVIQEWNR